MSKNGWIIGTAGLTTLAATQLAFGHAGHDHGETLASSFTAGLTHPVFGLDHLLAMVASGLIAVRAADRKALAAVPASFAALMVAGGLLQLAGVLLPVAEWGIALSVLVLGLLVAATPRVPTAVAAGVVGLFAVCHGWAHVAELHGQVAPYMLGFVLGTLALHAAAIALGLGLARAAERNLAVRVAGGAIAAGFAGLLVIGG